MVGAGEQKLCPAGDGTKFSDDKFVMVDRIMVQYIVQDKYFLDSWLSFLSKL